MIVVSLYEKTVMDYVNHIREKTVMNYVNYITEKIIKSKNRLLNIPMAGTARTGSWCQPIRSNVPMVPASEPLITSLNSVYFSH